MAPGTARYGRAVTGWARRYAFVPRYGREEQLSLRTADGVRLAGARLVGPPDAPATIVLVHGLGHSSRTPRVHEFARRLAREVHVVVPELRGHGRSGGKCTLGRDEPLDVAAAVAAAPGDLPVVTMGISLGGASALLHAGTYGGVAGVVAISSPAWWGAWNTPATMRIHRSVQTRTGRELMALLMRTRVAARIEGVPDASPVVGSIAPAFTLVVHDPADHYFDGEHAEMLYRWARDPKDLWLLPGTGHGTDLLGPALAERLLTHLRLHLDGAGHQ
jgi:pimeloyl-ACP methyl ester carboxylesterase